MAGALICILGVILLVYKEGSLSQSHDLWPKISLIVAEASFAFATIQSKAIIDKIKNTAKLNALQLLYGGSGLLLLALLSHEKMTVPSVASGYLILLYFIFVASIFANSLFFWLIKKTNPFFPSTWTYVSPMIAMVMGWLILNEKFGFNGKLGAFFVISGVLLANLALRKKEQTLIEDIKCHEMV